MRQFSTGMKGTPSHSSPGSPPFRHIVRPTWVLVPMIRILLEATWRCLCIRLLTMLFSCLPGMMLPFSHNYRHCVFVSRHTGLFSRPPVCPTHQYILTIIIIIITLTAWNTPSILFTFMVAFPEARRCRRVHYLWGIFWLQEGRIWEKPRR